MYGTPSRKIHTFMKSWKITLRMWWYGQPWTAGTCLGRSFSAVLWISIGTWTCCRPGFFLSWGSTELKRHAGFNKMGHLPIMPLQYANTLMKYFLGYGCRGSPVLPAPLAWPPRSPDLTICDNSLWRFIKGIVSQSRYNTTDELRDAVRQAFRQVTSAMLRKMWHRTWRRIILYHENDGTQTDLLDI